MSHLAFQGNSTSLFSRIFPSPGFLRMSAAGIDISDTTVRFIDFKIKNGKRIIKSFGAKTLPEGSMSGGYINKSEALIKVLSEIKKEANIDFANVSLPEENAYLFKMQVPKIADVELNDAVGFHIEENAPISAKDAVYDFILLGESDKETAHYDVMVSVIPSKVSEVYAQAFQAAGIMPLRFEISSQAISRSVTSPKSKESYLIVNLGDTKTGLAIVHKGMVFFTSTVPVGGEALNQVIAKVFNISPSSVSEIKNEIISSGKQDMPLFLKVMDATGPVKDEMMKLISYWQTHSVSVIHSPAKIDRIILCGKDTALPAVDEYVFAEIGIKTEVANVWQNIFSLEDFIPPIPFDQSLDFAGAIGLAMLS